MVERSRNEIRNTEQKSNRNRNGLRRWTLGVSLVLTIWGVWSVEGQAQGPRPAAKTATPPEVSRRKPAAQTPAAQPPAASSTAAASAAPPSAAQTTPSAELKQAIAYKPLQKDVVYTIPTNESLNSCTISYETTSDGKGWEVRDANGLLLRRFLDTDGDEAIDTWGYFHDGIEVYRDIDENHNGKADQYRWFHTGGTRWGLDPTEDGVIEQWKRISVEETSSELVSAIATSDLARFRRVLLTMEELQSLGLEEGPRAKIAEQIQAAAKQFQDTVASGVVPKGAVWAQFAGGRPGTVPATLGQEGKSSEEITIYENAIAVFETPSDSVKDATTGQIQLGTLIRIGDVWKTISVPSAAATPGIFFQPPTQHAMDATGNVAIAGGVESIHSEISEVEAALLQADAGQKSELFQRRETAYTKLFDAVKDPGERRTWVRQYADLTSYSVQTGDDPQAKERLTRLRDRFAKEQDTECEAYTQYQLLSADYNAQMIAGGENIDYAAIQAQWFASLEKFIADYPKSEKAAEAMFQMGNELELTGNEEKAKEWYTREATVFAGQPVIARAQGALRRLNAIGNPLTFSGKLLESNRVLNLEALVGKVVLICYWTSWNDMAKNELKAIRQLSSQYASKGLVVIAVNLDNDAQAAQAFLNEIKAPTSATWYNVWEEGGTDSDVAVAMGIHQTPTMLLVDEKGVVYERPLDTTNLTRDLKRMLR